MNIRRKDISVNKNYAKAYVLSTMYSGYFWTRTYYSTSLKEARSSFIEYVKKAAK